MAKRADLKGAETGEQKAVVGRVMHEFKHGGLRSAGGKVRSPRQAIAIALSEAGASNRESPEQRERNLGRTRREEGRATRAELYAEATRRGIAGRSRMNKGELEAALGGGGR